MRCLCDQLDGQISFLSVRDKQWFSETNLLTSNMLSMNEIIQTFSRNPANMICAPEEILVNTTIAIISWDTTMVEASVSWDQLVWVYRYHRLWIVYAIALVCTAACGAAGFVCMMKNEEVGDLRFSAIARATRNAYFYCVFRAETDNDAKDKEIFQYQLERKDGPGRFRIFQLAK
ncbi:hypothetical protein DFS33DRAFT_977932 [Desarmillaria ectypa]|nr:hypothetical protein DFS33DRAFT_977932 [Desarmillaria ectypa]